MIILPLIFWKKRFKKKLLYNNKFSFNFQGALKKKVTAVEARIFWLSLVACEIIWIFLIFSTLLRLRFAWLVSTNYFVEKLRK
jgi:hypothetical protein